MIDLLVTTEDDGRLFITPGSDEQHFSEQLLERADSRFLRVVDDRVIVQGRNGTWTYQIDSHEPGLSGDASGWVRTHLIESSDVGTDERFERTMTVEDAKRKLWGDLPATAYMFPPLECGCRIDARSPIIYQCPTHRAETEAIHIANSEQK